MPAPPAASERLRVRRLTPADANDLHALLSDPAIQRRMPGLAEAGAWYMFTWLSGHAKDPGMWGGFVGGRLVTASFLTRQADDRLLLAYATHSDFDGHGFSTRMARTAIAAHAHLKRPVIRVHVEPDNPASLRILDKLGLRDLRRETLFYPGRDIEAFVGEAKAADLTGCWPADWRRDAPSPPTALPSDQAVLGKLRGRLEARLGARAAAERAPEPGPAPR